VATKTSTESAATGMESDTADAENAVQEALRYNPNDLRLHLAALRIAQIDGKPQASDAELQQIVSRPAQTESDRVVQGEAYWSLGKYQEANQIFDQVLANSSRNPQKLLVLGDTLKANGNLEGAKKAYQMANAASPGGNNIKAQRAISRIETAQSEAQKSLRLAKSMNNPFQKRSAIDFYEETLAKDPQQPEARLALAKLYERTSQYDKAARSYEMYLGLVPNMKPSDREHYEHKIAKLREHTQQSTTSSTGQ
jgi:tetratricopeptide (TPR) repeat protein